MTESLLNLEARYYTCADVYARERERVFATTWQLLGPASQVQDAGAYLSVDVAGFKLFAVRDKSGELRAFHNVCRHRGAKLLGDGRGTCDVIRCPYHHWVYETDGRLRSAPWYDGETGAPGTDQTLDKSAWPLRPAHAAVWRGLLFVAIEPEQSLPQQLGHSVAALADEPIEHYHGLYTESVHFDANWKVYTDNFVEGYHIPGIHPEFFAAIDFKHFRTTARDGLVSMTAPARDELFYRGRWYWMWPNWTLSLFDGGMNTSRINPLGSSKTELIYHFYFEDDSPTTRSGQEQTIERNMQVIRQDFEICNQTQQNYAAGNYTPGPLSPRHEQGVAYFQQRLSKTLAT